MALMVQRARVIGEIPKRFCAIQQDTGRPRLTDDVLVKCGNDSKWTPRRAFIRNGHLIVIGASIKLPLRHLSLAAGSLPYSLALKDGAVTLLTIQTKDGVSFAAWLKTIAIELIRQTPLEAVRYLDILTMIEHWHSPPPASSSSPTTAPSCDINMNLLTTPNLASTPSGDSLEELLQRCQDCAYYVPVKDKLRLFENFARLGRKVRSSEDVSVDSGRIGDLTKRAHSLYDVSACTAPSAGVRAMCRWFENRNQMSINRTNVNLDNK